MFYFYWNSFFPLCSICPIRLFFLRSGYIFSSLVGERVCVCVHADDLTCSFLRPFFWTSFQFSMCLVALFRSIFIVLCVCFCSFASHFFFHTIAIIILCIFFLRGSIFSKFLSVCVLCSPSALSRGPMHCTLTVFQFVFCMRRMIFYFLHLSSLILPYLFYSSFLH